MRKYFKIKKKVLKNFIKTDYSLSFDPFSTLLEVSSTSVM